MGNAIVQILYLELSHLPRRMGKDWEESDNLPSTPAPSLEGDTNISYGDMSAVPTTS